MKKGKVETKSFTVFVGEDHICRSIVKPNAEVAVEEARKITEIVVSLTNSEPCPMLVDIRKIKSISKEARDHFAMKGRKPNVNSIGLLIKSPVSMLIGNFFIGINKSAVPTKLFTKEEKAIEWLGKFM